MCKPQGGGHRSLVAGGTGTVDFLSSGLREVETRMKILATKCHQTLNGAEHKTSWRRCRQLRVE